MPVSTQSDHVGQRIFTLRLCAIYQKSLRLNCSRCVHIAIIPAVPVWWLFERRRWDQGLVAAASRFYCSTCLVRRNTKVYDPDLAVTDDRPTDDKLRWPDERTWKKLVSRYRT